MKTLTLEAPAKINLTLDILGRRTDGYHDMRMVMQAVSLGDTVTVAEAAGGFSLLTEGISLPAGKVTLEQRAADAFFHRLGRPVPGLEVRLAKRVPAYAGLGGGSADVAAVLRCAVFPQWRMVIYGLDVAQFLVLGVYCRSCLWRSWSVSAPWWAAMCPSASGAAHVLQRDGVRS